jgi:hypothetical protein
MHIMIQTIQNLAFFSVARGVGFGVLGIICLMVGLSTNVARALEGGGVCFLLMTAILMLKAKRAPLINFRTTEVWIMLDKEERPPVKVAENIIPKARARALLHWAYLSAVASAVLFGAAVPMLLL